MDKARLKVDFNEMVDDDLCLLSSTDEKLDSAGNVIRFVEGLHIYVYMEDFQENGQPDPLVATGVAELNTEKGWSSHVKWCVRIDDKGIQYLSNL